MNDKRQQVSMDELDKATSDVVKHKAKTVKKDQGKSKPKKCLFTITEHLDHEIDKLALLDKRTYRSDIVKAGLMLFMNQSEEKQKATLALIKEMDGF